MKLGDFSGLANDYAKNRPDYSPSVLNALIGMLGVKIDELNFADVGAGTGIWTAMVARCGPKSVVAVEPNSDMRIVGERVTSHLPIAWTHGSAEATGLDDASIDWLSMASSFHWADFDIAMNEFRRVLKVGGVFTAIWNPRLIEANPVLVEIEKRLDTYSHKIERVSSGRSGITATLSDRLAKVPGFSDLVYIEGRHQIEMPIERYLGAWRSVNDLQVQLGEENFHDFLRFIESRLNGLSSIVTTYWTRSWSVRRVD